MGIILKQCQESSVILLEGAIDIASAEQFKNLLLQALGSGKEIKVALNDATDLDVTAVQLIWAARRASEGSGVSFTLNGAVPASVSSVLGSADLLQFLAPVDAR